MVFSDKNMDTSAKCPRIAASLHAVARALDNLEGIFLSQFWIRPKKSCPPFFPRLSMLAMEWICYAGMIREHATNFVHEPLPCDRMA